MRAQRGSADQRRVGASTAPRMTSRHLGDEASVLNSRSAVFGRALALFLFGVAGINRPRAVLEGGSPGLGDSWDAWVASGSTDEAYPLTAQSFFSTQLAPTYGANRASAVAYERSEQIGARGLLITVASAIFAFALLLLGVSGANASLKVPLGLAIRGAAAFVGVVVSLSAIVG